MLVLVLGFALRGLLRGMVSQVFAVLGLIAGLWTAGWVSQWVGAHWQSAQPAVAFAVLRWLIMVSAALAVAAVFHLWGDVLRNAVKATAVGWMDRLAGLLIGAGLGLTISSFALLAVLLVPWPEVLPHSAARARVSRPLMAGAATACSFGSRVIPGSDWLRGRFLAAERRAENARNF